MRCRPGCSPAPNCALALETEGEMLDDDGSSCDAWASSAFLVFEGFEASLAGWRDCAATGFLAATFHRPVGRHRRVGALGVRTSHRTRCSRSRPDRFPARQSVPRGTAKVPRVMINAERPLAIDVHGNLPICQPPSAQGALPACPHRGRKRESCGDCGGDSGKSGAISNSCRRVPSTDAAVSDRRERCYEACRGRI